MKSSLFRFSLPRRRTESRQLCGDHPGGNGTLCGVMRGFLFGIRAKRPARIGYRFSLWIVEVLKRDIRLHQPTKCNILSVRILSETVLKTLEDNLTLSRKL